MTLISPLTMQLTLTLNALTFSLFLSLFSLCMATSVENFSEGLILVFILNVAISLIIYALPLHNAGKLRPDFRLERKLSVIVGVAASLVTVYGLVNSIMDPFFYGTMIFLGILAHLWLLFFVTFKRRVDLKEFGIALQNLNPKIMLTEEETLLLYGLHSLRRAIPKQEGPITTDQYVSKSTQLFALHADNLYLHRRWAHELGGPDALLASQVVAAELEKRMEFCALTSTVSPGIFPRNHWASEIFQIECLHADDHMHYGDWARILRRFASYSRDFENPTEAAEILMKAVAAVADDMETRSQKFDLTASDRLALTKLGARGCSMRFPPLEESASICRIFNRRNNQPLPVAEIV